MLRKDKKKKFSVAEEDAEVKEKLIESNMYTSLPVAVAVIIIQLVFILFMFYTRKNQQAPVSKFDLGISICFFCISLVFFIISIICRKIKNYNRTFASVVVLIYFISNFLYGTLISINEYIYGSPLYMLIAFTIFLPMMFYVKPIIAILSLICTYSGMIFCILAKLNFDFKKLISVDFIHVVTFFMMIGFFFMAYIIRYKDKVHSAKAGIKLSELNENLQIISMTDALTGLKNRHALSGDFDSYINKSIVVMMSDVDDFKFYNDTFGHDIGDKILSNLAKALSKTFESKFCYRYGGDEFLVIFPISRESKFKAKIDEWKSNIESVIYNSSSVKSSCSCGYIYGKPESQAELNRMLQFADEELYEAKHRGKNCAVGRSYLKALFNSEKKQNIFMKQEDNRNDTDALTGTSSMTYFVNKAWLFMNNMVDLSREIGIVYFDIQNFKTFNERYGYTEGDKLLKSFAETLKLNFEDELVARFSDDHFVVLTYLNGIENKIKRIAEVFNSNWGKIFKAGIYKCDKKNSNEKSYDVSLLCDHARRACQSIKNSPTELFKYYDEELNKEQEKKIRIINRFSEALHNKEIKVFYQPIYNLKTRKITHFEALVRWEDPNPNYGFLKPDEFIPVLEEYRRIYEMDLNVLEQIAKDLHNNFSKDSSLKDFPISINISWLDFVLTPMIERIEKILKDYNISKKMICFEIKESSFLERADIIKEKIQLMKNAGFEVWLDNFGAGSFPLSDLDEYNFDVIKIDRKFMLKFYSDSKIHALLASFISSSKEMNLKYLAQGVETEEQFEELQSVGCDLAQGYFFGPAIPFEKIKEMYFAQDANELG